MKGTDYLETFERVLGDHALKFLERFGGKRLYIPTPERLKPDHRICQCLGPEKALALSREIGGQRIDVPMGRKYIWQERNQRVIALKNQGKSINEIADIIGCSTRLVYKILRDHSIRKLATIHH